jgi:uncharacterized membrane protein
VAAAARAAAVPEEVGNMNLFGATLPIDEKRVASAIAEAEQRTSGELRVLVARQPAPDPIVAAQSHFERLGMTQTAARNGVLIFIAPASRTFAVIGDTGVHEKCGPAFWRELADAMTDHFKRGEFTEGLVLGINRAGTLLATHYPRRPDDRNELPDAIENAE